MATPILQLVNVSKRFGPVLAVDNVDLSIEEGEFVTLLGASGSGKSTILMMIAGFEKPSGGEILLRGASILATPPHRRRIGIVFQNYALFPHLSVFENIAFGLRNFGWSKADIERRVSEMLELVQLGGLEDRLPGQISGGQQQRVALARALAFKPEVLLLDEPIGALDRNLREAMLAEFRRIHRVLGTTMVFVTHDQQEALVMSDRVAVMERGKLLRVDTPSRLFEHPGLHSVGSFVGDMNVFRIEATGGGKARILNAGPVIDLSERVAAGRRLLLGVRPEKIVVDESPDGWNHLDGVIDEVFYLGEATKYRVVTPDGLTLSAKQINRHETRAYALGDWVRLSWHPADGRFLEEAPEESSPSVAHRSG